MSTLLQTELPDLNNLELPVLTNYLPSTGNFIIFVSVLVIGLTVILTTSFVIFRAYMKTRYNIQCVIVEPIKGIPQIRNFDSAGIFMTKYGEELRLWKERPLVFPSAPDPNTIAAPSQIPSDLVRDDQAPEAPRYKPTAWFPKIQHGANLRWSGLWAKSIVPGKKGRPLLVLLYRNGQYYPYSWNVDFNKPTFDVLESADTNFYMDRLESLIRRRFLKETIMSKYGPAIAFAGVGMIFIIGFVFIYLSNQSLSEITGTALNVAQNTLDAAKDATTQQLTGGVA